MLNDCGRLAKKTKIKQNLEQVKLGLFIVHIIIIIMYNQLHIAKRFSLKDAIQQFKDFWDL